MRAAVLRHFIMPVFQDHLLVAISIIVATTMFECLIPEARSCLRAAPFQWLVINIVYWGALLLYHGLLTGLFVRKTRRTTRAAHVVFFFAMSMYRLHNCMWQPVYSEGEDGTTVLVAGNHSVLTVFRTMMMYPLPTMLVGVASTLPVLVTSQYMSTALPGNSAGAMMGRLGAQYGANALATLYGVRMAAYLCHTFEPVAQTLEAPSTFVSFALSVVLVALVGGVVVFYYDAFSRVAAGSPLGRVDLMHPRRLRAFISMRRGTNVRSTMVWCSGVCCRLLYRGADSR